jgi:hypothetical protein
MDPIAFFDHLAATSQSSHEGETEEYSTHELERSRNEIMNEKLLLNSRSLETVKPLKRDQEDDNDDQEEETVVDQQSFHKKWNGLVESHKLEKEGRHSPWGLLLRKLIVQ